MSTNKTPNYQLHSWTLQDDLLLREINENFSGLDAALAQGFADQLAALAQAVQQLEAKITQGDAAQASALNTAKQTLITGYTQGDSAQATALTQAENRLNTKIAAANTSISGVSTNLQNLLVFGTYQGDGAIERTISLGFTPRAVLLHTESGEASSSYGQGYGGLFLPGAPLRETYDKDRDIMAEIVTGGFALYDETKYGSPNYTSHVNSTSREYRYLAVR